MDLGNQQRIKDLCDQYGNEDLIVVLGGAEAEASGLAAETVATGDPTFAGPLAGVPLGLKAYHMFELNAKAGKPNIHDIKIRYYQIS